MAFQFNNNNAQSSSNEAWRADAFLNIWARRADGSKFKVGSISLKKSSAIQAKLIERLQEDDGLESLVNAMEMDFQLAVSEKEVNLGF